MFDRLRARLAAWIAPTTTPAPAAADHSTANTAGPVSGHARVVQARDINALHTGDTHTHTHTGDTHHHGAINTAGDMTGGTLAMAHEVNGINQISGTVNGNITWGNTGVINTGNAGIQAGHVSGGTIIA